MKTEEAASVYLPEDVEFVELWEGGKLSGDFLCFVSDWRGGPKWSEAPDWPEAVPSNQRRGEILPILLTKKPQRTLIPSLFAQFSFA